jgi:alpha-glucosidase
VADTVHRPWWEPAVIYQVYPRSYQDTNGDGVGDLPGIRQRLNHLSWLGVDGVWLSPIFPSPMADFGYDVADYVDVDPLFGSLADLDALVADAHGRGIRVLLDLVPNHSSDRHPWFMESRSSRRSPKRDWYIWADAAPGGGPPNNWRGAFGGSAWQWDEATGQYFYHAFLPQQPDLNWRNPEVRAAMADVLRSWLDRGIDGFRVDVIWHLIKDDQLRDNPVATAAGTDPPTTALVPVYTADRPEVHEVIAMLRAVVDEYEDRLLIGEIYLPVERLVAYYGVDARGVHLPFNFQLLLLPWEARGIEHAIREYERLLPPGGWPNWVLGNHDNPRIASRVGRTQARVAAMLLFTLRGTPTVYYGDEIGMVDVDIADALLVDPARHDGRGRGRDHERTPMQWDGGPNAGFTTGVPWLPLASDSHLVNVAAQREDARSMLWLHRRLIELRRAEPALAVGAYEPVESTGHVLAYRRMEAGRVMTIVLNLVAEPAGIELVGPSSGTWRILLSTGLDREGERVDGRLSLRGDEGVILVR